MIELECLPEKYIIKQNKFLIIFQAYIKKEKKVTLKHDELSEIARMIKGMADDDSKQSSKNEDVFREFASVF